MARWSPSTTPPPTWTQNDNAEVALGDPYNDCAPQTPDTQVEVATAKDGTFAPLGFFIVFSTEPQT
jgi:hypothetical protein